MVYTAYYTGISSMACVMCHLAWGLSGMGPVWHITLANSILVDHSLVVVDRLVVI